MTPTVLEYQIEGENFEENLTAFLLHIGYLMGYNNRPAQIVDEEMEEEPAPEQGMDEEEEETRAVENIEEFNLY
uniref:Uncharacterized protein n=1 Tax=Ditylenchus dipsaci TaxID=166011 RepID=A0A915D6W4_9BILA